MKNKTLLLTIVVILCVISLIVIIVCVASYASRTKNREYNEEEVLLAAQTLIKKSETLNEIFYGRGIEYQKDESTAEGAYYQADVLSLKRFGVETVDDIKKMAADCFTSSYSASIINTVFSSISDEDGIQILSRYYQKYNSLDDTPECIMVYKDADIFLTDKVVYDYSSIEVSYVKGEEVFVKIDVKVTNEENKTQNREIEIALLEESSGWRINSPTYARYFDREYYEDLKK